MPSKASTSESIIPQAGAPPASASRPSSWRRTRPSSRTRTSRSSLSLQVQHPSLAVTPPAPALPQSRRVPTDRDAQAFSSYYSKMPWLAVGYDNKELKDMCVGLEQAVAVQPRLMLTRPGAGTMICWMLRVSPHWRCTGPTEC